MININPKLIALDNPELCIGNKQVASIDDFNSAWSADYSVYIADRANGSNLNQRIQLRNGRKIDALPIDFFVLVCSRAYILSPDYSRHTKRDIEKAIVAKRLDEQLLTEYLTNFVDKIGPIEYTELASRLETILDTADLE